MKPNSGGKQCLSKAVPVRPSLPSKSPNRIIKLKLRVKGGIFPKIEELEFHITRNKQDSRVHDPPRLAHSSLNKAKSAIP